ncbi:MAG: hypothetical protein AAB492_02995 [Patescibacteria group bacterium]
MSAKASKESGNKFRCQIATRLRGGEVLSLADVNVIAKQHNLSLSAANTTFLNIESNSFATRTGLRAKRVRLGFGHSLVYEEGIDLQKTNISS